MYDFSIDNRTVYFYKDNIEIAKMVVIEDIDLSSNRFYVDFINNFKVQGFDFFCIKDLLWYLECNVINHFSITFSNGFNYIYDVVEDKIYEEVSLGVDDFSCEVSDINTFKLRDLLSYSNEKLLSYFGKYELGKKTTKNLRGSNLYEISYKNRKIYCSEDVYKVISSYDYLTKVGYFDKGDLFKPNDKVAKVLTFKKSFYVVFIDDEYNVEVALGELPAPAHS